MDGLSYEETVAAVKKELELLQKYIDENLASNTNLTRSKRDVGVEFYIVRNLGYSR